MKERGEKSAIKAAPPDAVSAAINSVGDMAWY